MPFKKQYLAGESRETKSFKQNFSQAVTQLLQPNNVDGLRVINSLQRLSRQMSVRNFSVGEVISIATLRGLESIERKEEPIINAAAWLTTVGTYIIRDMVKAEIRNRQLVEKQTSLSENADIWDGLLIGEEAQAVDAAIKLLSPEDQEILRLRFILELSYKDIQDYYLKQRDTSTSIPALRKRLARAAQRLRNKFIEMYWG
jgi:DNA-directed RNA polymerase specialized sigma24 family protein